jgi:hypothetical protein
MAALVWNVAAEKKFESGIDKGVLYVRDGAGDYPLGVAWEGLISFTEKPGGAEPTDLWANNSKYAQLISVETFEGTLEAYTYPDEFNACLGVVSHPDDVGMLIHQQARSAFGLVYRTYVGSEAAGQTAQYKLHLVYGLNAQPSEVARTTINDSPEAGTFSWELRSTPAGATGYEPVSMVTIDEELMLPADLATIEDELFGTGVIDPNLPDPDTLFALLTP